jgi:multiple sugar transport system substrate-binding protein
MLTRSKRLASPLAAVSAAMLLVGACSATESEAPNEPVSLRMTVWSANENHHALFKQIADKYIAKNPTKVKAITFQAIPSAEYVNTVTTQIAGGDSPDLAWVTEAYADEFVSSGVLQDLTPTLQKTNGYKIDDLLTPAMKPWSRDGKIFGYPFSNSPFGMYVNLDLIQSAGQPNPRDLLARGEWTWDKALEIAGATAKAKGVEGFIPSEDPYTNWNAALGSMWPSWGAKPWTADGKSCTWNTPEMEAFFSWFHAQVFDAKAIPAPGETADFAAGQAAMRLSQLSASASLKGKFKWDFLPMPAGPSGTIPVVGQGGVGVVKRGDHPDVAADFLAYFTDPENAALLAQFFPPPRKSALTVKVLSSAGSSLNEEQLQKTVIDQALKAGTKDGHIKMSAIKDAIRSDLDAIWTPEADVKAALAKVCTDIGPVIQAQ